jgi:hypothetical protein
MKFLMMGIPWPEPDMSRNRQQTQRVVPRLKSRTVPVAGAAHHETGTLSPAVPENPKFMDPLMQDVAQDALIVNELGDSWLQIRWLVSEKTLARAGSAMGRDSYKKQRVLRIHRISQDDSGPRNKALAEELPIPEDAREWYFRVPSTTDGWLVELGIVFGKGKFFSLLHSVPVIISLGRGKSLAAERLLMERPFAGSMEPGSPPPLHVRGTIQLNGCTHPNAHASIDDQAVPVNRQTGEFDWQLPLSNGRVVVPVTVTEAGKVQRALLAVEFNFHLLEPEPVDDD